MEHENGFDGFPAKEGLYDSVNEKDSCGVGFVVHIKGVPSRQNVVDALTMLTNMDHRGACGCEENTGDGAGILTGIPHDFMIQAVKTELGVDLPESGKYATGNVFLSKKEELREECREVFVALAKELKLKVLCWRHVPTDNSMIGPSALKVEPRTEQPFIVAEDESVDATHLERLCYVLRKRAGNALPKETKSFYTCSLSANIIIYKGQLTAYQVKQYFLDLQSPTFTSHLALVHSRFSTNTFPSWSRSQPFRLIGHNGEINTLRGNKNWMHAREGTIKSDTFGDQTQSLFPIIEPGGSDSAAFDNVLEFQLMNGTRTLPEIMMMMVPEAWQNDSNMPDDKKAFYEWASFVQEPWDGPALFTFTDGRYIGAILDRNGLRPARYYIMDDDRMIMASEVGVLQKNLRNIAAKGRLQPGRMLLVDTKDHVIVDDAELKHKMASSQPFREWLDAEAIRVPDLLARLHDIVGDPLTLDSTPALKDMRLQAFGWTAEHINMLVKPMVENKKEALGSMGNDAPLACLSKKPRLVYEYFKQLFAQVTNPPIDPFREKIVMSLRCTIGPAFNILATNRAQCHRLVINNPILSVKEFTAIKNMETVHPGWKVAVLDMTFPRSDRTMGLLKGLNLLCEQSSKAILEGHKLIILSDRNISADRVPISAALAVGAVHQHLLKEKTRLKCGLIVESGEINVVHQICVLIGFGCDAICPYLVFETMARLRNEKLIEIMTDDDIATNYKLAIDQGMRKVMAKMGISTLESYKGAQIFEAVGLGPDIINRCFTNCASRVKGVDFNVLSVEALSRHMSAYPDAREQIIENKLINNPGDFHWRDGGEDHMNSPNAIAAIQDASRRGDQSSYDRYVVESDKQIANCTLRGLLDFSFQSSTPIPIDEVESAKEIVKRFCTGAMSYGSISLEAHSTLAVAMNRIGGKSNTGEGGEDMNRFAPMANGDSMRSSIKQVASGRFGVTAWYLCNADEIQIKMAQGAKPGEGGELPGYKVSEVIASCRNSTPGVGLISPPPHHDIYSIEDLKQLIYDLKCANPTARVSVKLVSEVGVGVVAAGVAKGFADHILISGHDGGTGASSWTGIKHAGLPWELGLSETHQTLVQNNLRGRIVLQTDGQIRHGRDVAVACLLGAEEFGFATVPLIVMGCTMMRKCHLNTCPVGIATQNAELRKKFTGEPEHVVNYFFMVAEHCREIMAKLGFRTINEMVGRTDKLCMNDTYKNFKTKGIDLGPVLKLASELREGAATYNVTTQNHRLDDRKDNQLIELAQPAIKDKQKVTINIPILNTDRAFATTLSHHIVKAHGPSGLAADTIHINIKGSAGQSLGAFLAQGVFIDLIGDANDYVGKGLSGGIIVIKPNQYHDGYKAEENVIAGNVCMYGAVSGEAYFRGIVAERFCVRNSGATVVAEGCGDHGCEYMTGGRVLVLGAVGRNFAAGMSGGIAYVLDTSQSLVRMVNKELVELYPVEEEEDVEWIRNTLQAHLTYTGSKVAERLLSDWPQSRSLFTKVYPHDYRRVLEEAKAKALQPITEEPTVIEQENKKLKTEPAIIDLEDTIPNMVVDKKKAELHAKLDKVQGFMKYNRQPDGYRDPVRRVKDFEEISRRLKTRELNTQGARCMDCGVPFCQADSGCPLGNVIPQWNDLVYRNQWQEALNRLMLTNNFPEFTGRVCPAPCEGACVLGINEPPVAIKSIECAIIDKGFEQGWITPYLPTVRTGKRIAIIGGGPAGMAAADQLNKMGHHVTVYERQDRIGGLLMYGIPNMKLDKRTVQRRVDLLAAEGITFQTNCDVGKNVDVKELYDNADAMILTVGATWPRDLPIKGRELNGVYFAMDFLTPTTKTLLDKGLSDRNFPIDAKGKHVIVIGGGDTGNDCIGTSMRMGAASVVSFEILPPAPASRANDNPWPQWPRIFRVDYGHEEVKAKFSRDPRLYNIMTKEFVGDDSGNLKSITTVKVEWIKDEKGAWKMSEVAGSEQTFQCDLVLLAMGFLGPETYLREALGVEVDKRSNFMTPPNKYNTNVPKLYTAGDCRRGQSLIVWAISEGRQAARQVDIDLIGSTVLPVPGGIIPSRQEIVGTPLKVCS